MPPSEKCEDCKFFLFDPARGDGLCRRNPPLPVHTKVRDRGAPVDHEGVATFFPHMTPDGWCGEFKRKLVLQ